ncbi:MAG: hypothetical protein ACOY0T_35240 [Myxococcota bacterium]
MAERLSSALSALARAGSLESRAQTVLFWTITLIYSGCFLFVSMPPLVDYPQHLALATLLGKLFDANAVEHATYQADFLTYNGLFHMLVALGSRVLPPEWAGRLVLALIPPLLASAALALMRHARRPSWYAFLLLPMSYSYAVGWGFVNYCLAVPLALLTWVAWSRFVEGRSERAWPPAGLALLVAYAHGLTTLALFASAAVGFVFQASVAELGWKPWFAKLGRALLPLVPAAMYTALVFLHHIQAPHIGWEPEHEGDDLPAWRKLAELPWLCQGNLADTSDTWIFVGLALVLVSTCLLAYVRVDDSPKPPRACRALFVFWLAAYVVLPQRLFSTGFVFERLPVWIWAFALASAPRPGPRALVVLRWAASALTVLGSLNTARAFASLRDAQDASVVIDAIPDGSRVVALTYEARSLPAVRRPIFIHASAYYLVRKRGQIAYDFTRFASLPLRARDFETRPRLTAGLEWNPKGFDPSAAYARYYDTLLVVSEENASVDTSSLVEAGYQLTRVTEQGRFHLYRREPRQQASALELP